MKMNEQEKIRFENMKNTYNWWSKVSKSLGIILWYISMYCNFNLAERVLVGDGKVYYPGEKQILATFVWNDELNIPIFTFINGEDRELDYWNKNQSIYINGIKNNG
jgi:hypothetical protein